MTDERFRLLEHGQTCVANIKIDRDLIEWAEKREPAVILDARMAGSRRNGLLGTILIGLQRTSRTNRL